MLYEFVVSFVNRGKYPKVHMRQIGKEVIMLLCYARFGPKEFV